MLLRSLRANYVGITLFLLGIVVGVTFKPVSKGLLMSVSQKAYADVTFKCDHAMRSHLIAKVRVSSNPNEGTVQNLKAAEIALLDCQEYDLLRKKLIRWGLSENELSEMGLRAIEERGKTLQDVVRLHEIRY